MNGIATLLILALSPLPVMAQTAVPQTGPRPGQTPAPRTQPVKPSPSPTPKPQAPKPPAGKGPKTKPSPTPTPRDPKVEFDKAVAYADPEERLVAFQDYLAYFPDSPDTKRIKELMVSARAETAEKLLQEGDKENGVEMFKTAVHEAPAPASDDLFSKVILKVPAALFVREERTAAFEVAADAERLAGTNAKQLLGIATFYLSVQYGTEAIRIAKKAVEVSPELPLAYFTLGAATRLNFRLDESAAAYGKALELDPVSMSARKNLADLKRALGQPAEAAKLYAEILEKDAGDQGARSALALTLFDLGKREDAEAEMAKALEANPSDARLLSGAAFWYASKGDGAKAVELGQRSQTADPTFTWGYVAEARGLLLQNKPLEAEKVLLIARATANFPTLNYEIAAARYSAGLYREAVEILASSFEYKDGTVSTYLGNRVLADSDSIPDLLKLERKGAVLETNIKDDASTAAGLKGLLEFSAALAKTDKVDEARLLKGADAFIGGKDNMQTHRQLFVASRLLTNRVALAKAADYTKAAVSGLDASLDVPTPVAAVLADELYDTRVSALSRGEVVIVPQIDNQTLTSVMRGRIEELTGWSLLLQNDPAQAALRFRRGLTVLPEKSVWWRTSLWRLGNALEADNKPKEAIESYIKAYDKDNPDQEKYLYIEKLYGKTYGTLNGLPVRIGERPAQEQDSAPPRPEASESPKTAPSTEKIPDSVPVAPTDGKASNDGTKLPENAPAAVKADEPPPKETSNPKNAPPDAFDEADGDAAARKLEAEKKNGAAPRPPVMKPIKSLPALPEVSTIVLTDTDAERTSVATDSILVLDPDESDLSSPPPPKANFRPAPGANTGPGRSRVVSGGSQSASKECGIVASRDEVTILPSVGLWGLLVDLRNGDNKTLSAASGNPEDVSVRREASPNGDGRAFFAIRSISARAGDYRVTISSPCDRKEIKVLVRGL